jgi:hypothetical protein
MRGAWQEFSALFGSAGPEGHPAFPVLLFGLCAGLAYPLATEAGYGGAILGAFIFCIATLFLAYSLGAGALAFRVEAERWRLPGSRRLERRAGFIALLLLLVLLAIPAAALLGSPTWEAWVPTALVLGIALAGVSIPLLSVTAVGLLLLVALLVYWAARGPADHQRDMELFFALLSAALALAPVSKWRRVIQQGSRSPGLAGPLLRRAWLPFGSRRITIGEISNAEAQRGFRDRASPVTIIRTCLGGCFARQPMGRTTILVSVIVIACVAVVVSLPLWGGTWHSTVAFLAFLAATLLSSGFLRPLSKLTRGSIAELALLPGLGDGAVQRRGLCWAVLAPPLSWLAGILAWSSACLLLKGEPLSSVAVFAVYILIVWLTYGALALLKLVTFPASRRIPGLVELWLLYLGVYLCAVYSDIYTLHPFTHVGGWLWWFWVTPILLGIGFVSAIGYAVRRLATAPHPFLA